jgi:8-oxo-dGTP pyrophosphatase MutT (NUDIX family)
MGQRHAGHVFMPDKFVFPGGRLDRADHRIRPVTELRPAVADRVAVGTTPGRARALALAAVRETFEEAGLLVGARVARPQRSRSPSWRRFLAEGVAPTLDGFEFVARAITPPGNPRRYDARFFMADASLIQGDLHEALGGDGELLDLRWVPVGEAQSLDLPEVTHFVIDEVARRLAMPRSQRDGIPVPFYRFRGEKPIFGKL